MKEIDLNCDMGEIEGVDEQIMPLISSANIACGGHAGDDATMHNAVSLAIRYGVSIGAHPSYCDRQNFGRVEIDLAPAEVRQIVIEQIERLKRICNLLGTFVSHVKPHGALYNRAAAHRPTACAIAEAVCAVDPSLVVFGLAGSEAIRVAAELGLHTAAEVFADRNYLHDGTLMPRTAPNAVITDPSHAAQRIIQLIETGTIEAIDGTQLHLPAETICLHGDSPSAVEMAKTIRQRLNESKFALLAVARPRF